MKSKNEDEHYPEEVILAEFKTIFNNTAESQYREII